MIVTPEDLLKLLRPSDLLFTEHGNFRIKDKAADGTMTLEKCDGRK